VGPQPQKYEDYTAVELQQLIDIATKHNDMVNVGFYKSALGRRQAADAHQALKITERRLEKVLDELDSDRDWVAKKHADVVKLQAELAEKDRIHADLIGQLHSTACKPQQQSPSTPTQINVRDLLVGRLSEISIVGGDELLGVPSAEYDFSTEGIHLLQSKQKELLAGAQALASTLYSDLVKTLGEAKKAVVPLPDVLQQLTDVPLLPKAQVFPLLPLRLRKLPKMLKLQLHFASAPR
ncbi:unnamed protein product, partial [Prorocentrum cordatum]